MNLLAGVKSHLQKGKFKILSITRTCVQQYRLSLISMSKVDFCMFIKMPCIL